MIRKKKGVHIGDREIVADGLPLEDAVNFVSHAHADHALKSSSNNVICSEKTQRLVEERFDVSVRTAEKNDIQLHSSGHIVGSCSALINDKVLYTGDVSTQDRVYMKGFSPVEAQMLITESTYGIPSYRLPDQEKVVAKIKDWIKDSENQNLFLFGYSLGKAQKIQKIVQDVTDRPILAHQSIIKMNRAVESVTNLEFEAEPYTENKEKLEEDGILIAPSRSSRAEWIEKLEKKHSPVKAGFSGWAVDDSFRHRGGYDKTFPLSDHCGFDDLVELVKEVDPEKIYTHHGFDEAFASYLSSELGFSARALKKNQSSLDDF